MHQISTRFNHALELLESLVDNHRKHLTTLVVCSSREDFFIQILQQIEAYNLQPAGLPGEEPEPLPARPPSSESQPAFHHSILIASLHLHATSGKIKLVYCPSLPTLRAYLSSSAVAPPAPSEHQLLILDLIALHHGTSEFTLQGLSRTMATAVSAAHQTQSDLKLVECKDIGDLTNPNRGPRLWDAQVPLLSGSIKIGQEGSRWAGRASTIRSIAARWLCFESAPEGIPLLALDNEDGQVEEMLIDAC